MTQDEKKSTEVNTSGGAAVGKDVNSGRDFVGRDNIMVAGIDQKGQTVQNQINLAVSTEIIEEEMVGIVLRINRNFDDYSEADQTKLLEAIRVLLKLNKGDIKIIKRSPGSVRLTISLPISKVDELFKLVREGKLDMYDVDDVIMEKIVKLEEAQLQRILRMSQVRNVSRLPPSQLEAERKRIQLMFEALDPAKLEETEREQIQWMFDALDPFKLEKAEREQIQRMFDALDRPYLEEAQRQRILHELQKIDSSALEEAQLQRIQRELQKINPSKPEETWFGLILRELQKIDPSEPEEARLERIRHELQKIDPAKLDEAQLERIRHELQKIDPGNLEEAWRVLSYKRL